MHGEISKTIYECSFKFCRLSFSTRKSTQCLLEMSLELGIALFTVRLAPNASKSKNCLNHSPAA